jgi:hypothetical protein
VSAPERASRAELVQRLVVDLGAAFQHRTTYAPGHPQVTGTIARLLAALSEWCARSGTPEVSLILLEGHLLVDRESIPDEAPWGRGLLRAFHRYGIQGMTLLAGLEAGELGSFLDACAGGQRPTPSRHILIGQAGLAGQGSAEGPAPAAPSGSVSPAGPSPEQVEGASAELRAIASGAVTRIERLRFLVAKLAHAAEAGSPGSVDLAATRVNDREFLHGLAVSLATLRLARALRVEGKALEDLALAGFLHDVGHLEAVEGEVNPEWRRSHHPVRGAARLAGLEGIPDVAVLVAYEHHLRVDGAPSYPRMAASRRPRAAARVVAVADTWETLRGRGQSQPAEALAILRSRAGTFLDPALVDLFAEAVRTSPQGAG